jgi:hypothetical protein
VLTLTRAYAYVNQGQWIADCPAGCGNAMALRPKQTEYLCGLLNDGHLQAGCGALAEVGWPPDAVWIWDALLARRDKRTRNWAPAGHRQALVTGFPNGQSVADLIAETAEHGGQ